MKTGVTLSPPFLHVQARSGPRRNPKNMLHKYGDSRASVTPLLSESRFNCDKIA